MYVLDSWPLLELYRGREPGASRFEHFLTLARSSRSTLLLSRINFGEIRYKSLHYFTPSHTDALLEKLRGIVDLVSVDDELVDEAALLKATYHIAYADCFAAALAIRHDAPVITGDKEFLALQNDGILKLHWLGA